MSSFFFVLLACLCLVDATKRSFENFESGQESLGCSVNPLGTSLKYSDLIPKEELLAKLHVQVQSSASEIGAVLESFLKGEVTRLEIVDRLIKGQWHGPLARFLFLKLDGSKALLEESVKECDFNLLNDLIDYSTDPKELFRWYLTKYGLKHATHAIQPIQDLFESTNSISANTLSSLSLLFTKHPIGHRCLEAGKWDRTIDALQFLCQVQFDPAGLQIPQQSRSLLEVEDLFSRFSPHLKNIITLAGWLSLQSPAVRELWTEIHSDDPQVVEGWIENEFNARFWWMKSVDHILEIPNHTFVLKFLAKSWPQKLRRHLQQRQVNFAFYATAAWLHPPFAEQLPLPDTMPPISELIPQGKNFSFEKYRYFRVLLQKYGVAQLKKAMERQNEENMESLAGQLAIKEGKPTPAYTSSNFKYLEVFDGAPMPQGANLQVALMPAYLTEDDRAAWWHAVLWLSAGNAHKVIQPDGVFLRIGWFLIPYN